MPAPKEQSAFDRWWYDYCVKNGIQGASLQSQRKRESAFHAWNAALAHAEKVCEEASVNDYDGQASLYINAIRREREAGK